MQKEDAESTKRFMLTLSKTSENVLFYFMSLYSKLDKNFTETIPTLFYCKMILLKLDSLLILGILFTQDLKNERYTKCYCSTEYFFSHRHKFKILCCLRKINFKKKFVKKCNLPSFLSMILNEL